MCILLHIHTFIINYIYSNLFKLNNIVQKLSIQSCSTNDMMQEIIISNTCNIVSEIISILEKNIDNIAINIITKNYD